DGKNSKLIQFSNRVKPAWLQGFGWTKRTTPRRISSQARYDHFDTLPYIKQMTNKANTALLIKPSEGYQT
ncbi:MAG: hypothetical protein DBX61_02540, partial [Clostridiales bacterium]